jgi:hypothetical protein
MPSILYAWTLTGLVAVPVLVTLYLLHNRFRQREVSSLFLWRHIGRRSSGGSRFRNILPPPVFWVELLAILLLIAAAAAPCFRSLHDIRPLIIVLDDSFSMQAAAPGGTIRQQAEKAVREAVAELSPSKITVVWARRIPQVGRSVDGIAGLSGIFREWNCRYPSADLDGALTLACSRANANTRVLVVADRPPRQEMQPGQGLVRWIAVGQPLANAAIATAVRAAVPNGPDRVLVEIRGFSRSEEILQELAVTDSRGQPVFAERFSLAPGAVKACRFTCPVEAGALTLKLQDDALAADNVRLLLPPRRLVVRVLVGISAPRLRADIVAAVESAGGLVVSDLAKADLLVTDLGSASLAPGSWTLAVLAGKDAVPNTGPFVLQQGHPLLEGVSLADVVWCASPSREPAGMPLAMGGNTVLVADQEVAQGGRLITFNLDAAHSTLPRTTAWPILVWNLLGWRTTHLPGFASSQVVCGQWVTYTSTATGAKPRLTDPEGTVATLSTAATARAVGFVPEIPGIYRMEENGQSHQLCAVPGDTGESDLTECGHDRQGTWLAAGGTVPGFWNAAWIFALVALAFLALQVWMLTRMGEAVKRQQGRG